MSAGIQEIHIVFDNPGRFNHHPKDIERERRTNKEKGPHAHCEFKDEMKIPSNWRDILECRECKRKLVLYLGDRFLLCAPKSLKGAQKLVIAGVYDDLDKDSAWSVTFNSIECPEENLKCNAEECDTRLWLHVKHTKGENILIFSPDTDVYHIGLTVDLQLKKVFVQINPMGRDLRLLDLNKLITKLEEESEIEGLPIEKRRETMQVLYVATGSDFTSFFVGITKVTFLKTFYEHHCFILSSPNIPGSLTDVEPESNGFLAFMRLVGRAYFMKNRSAFQSTLTSHFDSFEDGNIESQHHQWYKSIRSKIWERIIYEEYLPPSIEALKLHWLRTIWVVGYWRQATSNEMVLLPEEWFGWKMKENKLIIEWDTDSNLQCVKERVAFLTHGCGCKIGCDTGRCKCFKSHNRCGPGCNCSNCQNHDEGSYSYDLTQ